MPVLSCSNLTKSYIVDTILEGISFSVEPGDKIGVIGLNGSGKTTLFNILSGNISKDSGDIYIQKDLVIGYLQQHIKIDSENTIYEECLSVFKHLIDMEKNLRSLEERISTVSLNGESEELDNLMNKYAEISEKFQSSNGYGYKSEIRGVLIGLGFKEEDFDKEVNILSGGQKSRLSLGKLLLQKPDLLLLDEPTNHLDIDAIDWLERFLKDYKGATLIISHDRYFLDNVVNRIFYLENKKIDIYNSNYTKFMNQRKKDLEILKKQYEDQQKELKRQEEIIARFMNYGDARYIKQAQSRQKLLDKIKLIDRPIDSKKSRIRFEPQIKSGRDVLLVENIKKSFGDFNLLEDIDLSIYRGEKVGLIGPNGIGKTTLFKIILGEIEYDEGSINLGTHVVPGYFDQEMDNLHLEKSVIDEIWDEYPKMNYYEIRTILSQFLFVGDDIFKEISDLSGGERGRLSLLKLMLSNANLLLMDEPTNHLDIDSKEVLEDAILDYEGTLFVISHDRYFLNRVTNKILELTTDGIKEYMGNYDYYLEKKNEVLYEEEDEEGKTKTQLKLERKKEKELLALERQKKKEIKKIEKEISEKESALNEIDHLLADPESYDNHEKIVELSQKREVIQTSLDRLYEEWILLTN
ncbi:MAG: ABC-F family ATP-binding cassette domain-containing protein [Tissierella sp.]|nr:ABC-F family ATP-binding cassette domain-containing protein [Tissierella sp.]